MKKIFELYGSTFEWNGYTIASDQTAMIYTEWLPMTVGPKPDNIEAYTKYIRPQSDEHFTQTIRRKELKKAIAEVPLKPSVKKVPCNKCIDGRREEDCGYTKVEVDCKYCGATEAGRRKMLLSWQKHSKLSTGSIAANVEALAMLPIPEAQ